MRKLVLEIAISRGKLISIVLRARKISVTIAIMIVGRTISIAREIKKNVIFDNRKMGKNKSDNLARSIKE